jgi:hypothetical protein
LLWLSFAPCVGRTNCVGGSVLADLDGGYYVLNYGGLLFWRVIRTELVRMLT